MTSELKSWYQKLWRKVVGNETHHGWLEEGFETALFSSRLLVLIPVIGILIASIIMFARGTIEIIQGILAFKSGYLGIHPTPIDDKNVILAFIPAIDDYLFATILLIISMGLYELFISEIDPKCRKNKTRPVWLRIHNLDHLTSRIGEMVIMILIVNFFKESFKMEYKDPKDLLILGGGVLLVSGSLLVAHFVSDRHKTP
jgi:uncharacterized membrane protein YqhA